MAPLTKARARQILTWLDQHKTGQTQLSEVGWVQLKLHCPRRTAERVIVQARQMADKL